MTWLFMNDDDDVELTLKLIIASLNGVPDLRLLV